MGSLEDAITGGWWSSIRIDITVMDGQSGGSNLVNESTKSDPSFRNVHEMNQRQVKVGCLSGLASPTQHMCKRARGADIRSDDFSDSADNQTTFLEASDRNASGHPINIYSESDHRIKSTFCESNEHGKVLRICGELILLHSASLIKTNSADSLDYGSRSATSGKGKSSNSNEDCSSENTGHADFSANFRDLPDSAGSADTSLDVLESEEAGVLEIRGRSPVVDMKMKDSDVLAGFPASFPTNGCDCFGGGRCPPHGLISICGFRRTMEDAVTAVSSFLSARNNIIGTCEHCRMQDSEGLSTLHFFGVYDGHGGPQAALFCKEYLHQALAEEVRNLVDSNQPLSESLTKDWKIFWQKALMSCFLKMDKEVAVAHSLGGSHWCRSEGNEKSCAKTIPLMDTGSTAVVAIIAPCHIIVGNCGDSRAVLSRGGQAIPLSIDHKPDREDEMARVEAAGGTVIFWNDHRVLGVLAMSRAIGDWHLKPFITAEPEVTCTARTREDECLILASDGLWDVLSNEMACKIARRCLSGRICLKTMDTLVDVIEGIPESPAATAAAVLTKIALARGSRDNISVVVLDLRVKSRKKP